jgi:hypothetical protein
LYFSYIPKIILSDDIQPPGFSLNLGSNQKSITMKKHLIKYGIWAGIINIVLGLTNWYTVAQAYGPGLSQTLGYLSMAAALLCIPFGIKYHRDQINEGLISFGQGIAVGMGISVVAAIITFLYSLIFFIFAGDDFGAWQEKWLTAEELQAAQEALAQAPEFVASSWFQALILGITGLAMGLIISLISATVLKKS